MRCSGCLGVLLGFLLAPPVAPFSRLHAPRSLQRQAVGAEKEARDVDAFAAFRPPPSTAPAKAIPVAKAEDVYKPRLLVSSTPWNEIPEGYAAKQLTMNRVRGCAETNKDELIRLIGSPEVFTSSGKRRMDEIVKQLVVSAPLDRPALSAMTDGRWVRQGIIASETHVSAINACPPGKGPAITTYKFRLSGLVAVSRVLRVAAQDAHTFTTSSEGARVSLFGLATFKLPRLLGPSLLAKGPRAVRILYLDSDLLITATSTSGAPTRDAGGGGDGGVVEHAKPEVFIKPDEFNEQVELRRLARRMEGRGALLEVGSALRAYASTPWSLRRSPLRLRERLRGLTASAVEGLTGEALKKSTARSEGLKAGRGASGQGLIGEVNWLAPHNGAAAAWATEDDVLGRLREEAALGGLAESDFVVGDLLSGKLKRRLRAVDTPDRSTPDTPPAAPADGGDGRER